MFSVLFFPTVLNLKGLKEKIDSNNDNDILCYFTVYSIFSHTLLI